MSNDRQSPNTLTHTNSSNKDIGNSLSLTAENSDSTTSDQAAAMYTSKRRTSARPPASQNTTTSTSNGSTKSQFSEASRRKKRFIAYSIAFATMLALSSVLDVRRASLKHRTPKLQLSLPSSASLSSLPGSSQSTKIDSNQSKQNQSIHDTNSTSVESSQQDDPSLRLRPIGLDPLAPHAKHAQPVDASKIVNPNLSEQELKDDVDQLIAHVDQESNLDTSSSSENKTETDASDTVTKSDSSLVSSITKTDDTSKSDSDSKQSSSLMPSNSSNNNSTEATSLPDGQVETSSSKNSTDIQLNSEDHFDGAKKRLEALLNDEMTKKYIDENDLRTLQALELQATRGDCDQKSGDSRSTLFKTDAEAASTIDIEKTDPLWGAWCLFMGSYKSDAMRDYVTKQQVLERKVELARLADLDNKGTQNQSGSSSDSNQSQSAGEEQTFDANAASLDDVMPPDQQSALRRKTDTIMSHLRDHDVRYLAALSLQASFGDCGPYGKEVKTQPTEAEEKPELRTLREPLLEQTVTRLEGAQWGAWCVLQGKKRLAAAAELRQRIELLFEQFSSQAAEQVASDDTSSASNLLTSSRDQQNEQSPKSL